MELYYCAICGLRITDAELKSGDAVLSAEKRALCKKCFSDVSVAKGSGAKHATAKPKTISHTLQSAKPGHAPYVPQSARKKKSSPTVWIGAAAAGLFALILFAMSRGDTRSGVAEKEPKPAEKLAPPPATPATPDVSVKPAIVAPAPVASSYQSTFKAVPINSRGNKRGYWEFLPSAYYSSPAQQFPIVIFFCDVPESGDGSAAQLDKVLKFGPPRILSDTAHPLHSLFEQRSVIVISAQGPNPPDWWHAEHIRPFVADILKSYRIDSRRIYLTGQVAGSLALHEVIDRDAVTANQVAAFWMGCSQGGAGLLGGPKAGPETAAKIPYWTFINNASSKETLEGINAIAARISGKPSNVMANAPDGVKVRTALFSGSNGWTWNKGIPAPGSASPILTLVEGTPQETGAIAYDKVECWDWLLAQQKK